MRNNRMLAVLLVLGLSKQILVNLILMEVYYVEYFNDTLNTFLLIVILALVVVL